MHKNCNWNVKTMQQTLSYELYPLVLKQTLMSKRKHSSFNLDVVQNDYCEQQMNCICGRKRLKSTVQGQWLKTMELNKACSTHFQNYYNRLSARISKILKLLAIYSTPMGLQTWYIFVGFSYKRTLVTFISQGVLKISSTPCGFWIT